MLQCLDPRAGGPFQTFGIRAPRVSDGFVACGAFSIPGGQIIAWCMCPKQRPPLVLQIPDRKRFQFSEKYDSVSKVFRHAKSVFSMHSDTQAVPAFHCIRMFKGIFRHARFKNAPTRCLPMLKEASDIFSTLGRRQRAPENATHPKTQVIDRSQNLRFRVCCVFGCVLAPS